MIEKIMRAVKSNNKKRGRNITIGTVVGMLLSCTIVIKADDNYLWLKGDGGEIKFSTVDDGGSGEWKKEDPYSDGNSWNGKTYINNIVLFGEDNGKELIDDKYEYISYGLRLSGDLGEVEFINNGLIFGDEVINYAIYNDGGNVGSIKNNGTISGNYFGIYNYSLKSGTSTIGDIVNTGVIYGKYNAINNSGTINNAYNYGILISDGESAIPGLDIKNEAGYTVGSVKNNLINYGLIINNGGAVEDGTEGIFTPDGGVIVGYENGKELRRNMEIYNFNDSTTITYSVNDSIMNSSSVNFETIKETKITGSIINSYKTALKFNIENKSFTLSGTIVNGGIKDGKVALSGNDKNNILILEGAYVSYIDGENRFQHTIINGDIDMGNGNNCVTLKNGSVVNGSITTGTGSDTFTIENGSQINGILEGGTGDDTLTFEKKLVTKSNSNNDEIRIQHNISNFEKINVNSNVTFYENGVEVTGANKINIDKDGVLTLRINGSDKDSSSGKIKGHALYGNTGTITSEGGTFLLSLNGAGKKNIISFNNTTFGTGLEEGSEAFGTTSKLHTVERISDNEIMISSIGDLPDYLKYPQLNKIYHGILSIEDLIGNFNVDDDEKLSTFLGYLNDIYAGSPYSYSSELSRKSAGMFRDIVVDNIFRPETGKWMIYGGLTHVDGGTKDTYYGKGYYTYDIGSSDMDAETKITGAYMLGEYGVSDTLTSGVVIGGNKLKSDLSNSSKVDGSAMYLGAYAKKYIGNLKVTAGAGFQYGDYDADRLAVNKVASDSAESVMKYSDNYNDMTYDIYLNGRYSHQVGDNLFLEPYATLSYTYVDQDGADEGGKALAIETDSKSFDYTVGKMGVDLKKVIPHEKGKSTLTAGVSYTKILDGAAEEYITGRFKGGSDFDILVAHKNEHSIGLNAKYALELENGVLFDVKGTYSVERDSHNGSGKNKTKGEWIVGAGMGYKF